MSMLNRRLSAAEQQEFDEILQATVQETHGIVAAAQGGGLVFNSNVIVCLGERLDKVVTWANRALKDRTQLDRLKNITATVSRILANLLQREVVDIVLDQPSIKERLRRENDALLLWAGSNIPPIVRQNLHLMQAECQRKDADNSFHDDVEVANIISLASETEGLFIHIRSIVDRQWKLNEHGCMDPEFIELNVKLTSTKVLVQAVYEQYRTFPPTEELNRTKNRFSRAIRMLDNVRDFPHELFDPSDLRSHISTPHWKDPESRTTEEDQDFTSHSSGSDGGNVPGMGHIRKFSFATSVDPLPSSNVGPRPIARPGPGQLKYPGHETFGRGRGLMDPQHPTSTASTSSLLPHRPVPDSYRQHESLEEQLLRMDLNPPPPNTTRPNMHTGLQIQRGLESGQPSNYRSPLPPSSALPQGIKQPTLPLDTTHPKNTHAGPSRPPIGHSANSTNSTLQGRRVPASSVSTIFTPNWCWDIPEQLAEYQSLSGSRITEGTTLICAKADWMSSDSALDDAVQAGHIRPSRITFLRVPVATPVVVSSIWNVKGVVWIYGASNIGNGLIPLKCLIDQNARTIPPVDNAACTLHETASSFIGFLRRGDRGTHNVVSGVAYGNWIRFKEQGTWRHMIVANISGMEIYRDFGVEVMLNRVVKPVGDLYKLLIYHDRTVFQIAFQEEITCYQIKDDIERLLGAIPQASLPR